MRLDASFWDGDRLRLRFEDGSDLDWTGPIHWAVGDDQFAPDPPDCVFEPRCLRDGVPCDCPIGARPHVVYAAFYGTLPKVGMTSARRVATRLREQGADAGFVIARTADRGAARRIEKEVRLLHRIPEWRTHKEKLPQWTRPVPWERIQERSDDLRRRLAQHFDPSTDLIRIEHPLPVLPKRPHRMESPGVHRGTVVGAKGAYLVYRPEGIGHRLPVGEQPLLALKHTDLVGRTVQVQ